MQPAASSQQPRRLEQSVLLASVLAWAESEQLPSSIMQTSCRAPQRGGKPRHAPGEQAHPPHPTPCPPYLRQNALEPEEGSERNQRPHPDEVCRINTGRQKAELDPLTLPLP